MPRTLTTSTVRRLGRSIPFPESWDAAQAHLHTGQQFVFINPDPDTRYAVLIEDETTFERVRKNGSTLYIVEESLARTAM